MCRLPDPILRRGARTDTRRLSERLSEEGVPDELREMVGSFNEMLDRLQEAFQRLSQFSADLAHEFRTPIGNLLGENQVALSRPRRKEEYESLLASNVEELERLSGMIEKMLFLARAENAELLLNMEEVNVGEDLARLAEYFDGPAGDAAVTLSVEAKGTLVADRLLLRRALGNLIANAIRFTPAGGTVRIIGAPAGHEYAICVQNPGPVIAVEQRERIFDRFYRTDASRAESSTSTGLGLAIVRSIMKLHHGRVEVSRTTTSLTEFRLVFPPTPDPLGRA